jgi:hypothetical protein
MKPTGFGRDLLLAAARFLALADQIVTICSAFMQFLQFLILAISYCDAVQFSCSS